MIVSERIVVDDNNIDSIRQRHPEGLHFVVGDTHGEKETLKALMSKISFDSTKDHVYFVGDYNEGGFPEELLKYMALYYQEDYDKPGFHMIRGNHERELHPLYALPNLPDVIVLRGAFLNFYIVHAGMVSLAYEAINEDMNSHPEKKVYAYSLEEYCTGYDAPLRQLTWSRHGLYSQNSHWLKHRWPTTEELHKNHACVIHGHSPYCFFVNNNSSYGDKNLFWEKQHVWFSEDLCSYNVDSNIKGRYANGEMYRGLSCICLEVCDTIASQNRGMLTIEGICGAENGVFSAALCPGMSVEKEGDIYKILNAKPEMKTITVDPSGKIWMFD